eukprot:6192880-Pleurochrysis_carterae.AAC.2
MDMASASAAADATHCRSHGVQAVSEVATFGAYFSTESSAPRTDLVAGMGARTRQATPSSELARALGYGALSCANNWFLRAFEVVSLGIAIDACKAVSTLCH